jgi:hypothetical protein
MFQTFPHAKPATDLPIGAVVTVTNPKNGKQVVYTKTGDNQWDCNVFSGLRHQFDNAVGWWMTHRPGKTTVQFPN